MMAEIPGRFEEASVLVQAGFMVWYNGTASGLVVANFFELKKDEQEIIFQRYCQYLKNELDQLRERMMITAEESSVIKRFFESLSVRLRSVLNRANKDHETDSYSNPIFLASRSDEDLRRLDFMGAKTLRELRTKLKEHGFQPY